MSRDFENLADIDPARVPLPAGTEVETRVVGICDGRQIPLGAVGRVVSSEAGSVRVRIVGVGVLEYRRASVVPRKSGQLRYALKREGLWRALRSNVVLESVVGSRAWGLADAGSDLDCRGVFVAPLPWTIGLVEVPTEIVSLDGSRTFWEIEKAIRLALRADPNVLEMLFVNGAQATCELGQWLLDARNAFVSSAIYGSFGRYALGQLKRLRQSKRLADHRGYLLKWLREDPSLTLDQAADRLAVTAQIDGSSQSSALLAAKQYIKQLYGSLFDRGLLQDRNFDSLIALARSDSAIELSLPRELRPKNAYNLLRLIDCATHWLTHGVPRFVVAEPLRGELVAIKGGEIELEAVIGRGDQMAAELEEARQTTSLPATPDLAAADGLLRAIRIDVARRYCAAEKSVFGVGGADPPPIGGDR